PQHDSLLTPNSLPQGGAILHPTLPAATAPVCQGHKLSLPSCAPPVRTCMLPWQTPLLPSIMVFTGPTPPLLHALGIAACLSARTYANVIGIPSSHAKYPLGSGAFSLRGYFAWSGI